MNISKEHMTMAAEKWAAIYEAVKGIEASDGKISTARELLKRAYPTITRDQTVIQLMVMERNGYIEGVRGADGMVLMPMAVKITEKGHEYFKRMIEETKELARELGEGGVA